MATKIFHRRPSRLFPFPLIVLLTLLLILKSISNGRVSILAEDLVGVSAPAEENQLYESIRFSDEELRRFNEENARFVEPDPEAARDFGEFMADFFHDSQAQLTLDLDLFREIYSEFEKAGKAAAEGDVDHIAQILQFFEPLKQYDISAPCMSDLFHYLITVYHYAKTASVATRCTNCSCTKQYRESIKDIQWIFDVIDAFGKIPAALVTGNNLWTGSWQTCRKISAVKNNQGQLWRGQYCMSRFQPYERHNPLKAFLAAPKDPAAVCTKNQTALGEEFEEWSDAEKKCFEMMPLLNLGLCTPDTCTDYDVRKIIQFIYGSVELATGKKLVCNVLVKCSNSRRENQLYGNTSSTLVLCFLLLIGSLMLFGTCYDVYIHQPLEQSLAKLSGEKREDKVVVPRALLQSKVVIVARMFSVSRNLRYIMNTSTEDGQIRCLHGLRVFSMSWVIFAHTYYYIATSLTMDNLLQTLRDFPKYFYNQIVLQAPLAVDAFFFLSGLLTAYIFLGKLKKGHFRLDSWQTWFAFYFRRYLRLTPVYVVILVLELHFFPKLSEGPFWKPIEVENCRWWANLLYVNNFIDQGTACLGWTWYLANDFQLYCFVPILLIALHRFKVGGVLLGVFVIIATSAVNLYITIQKDYPPAPLLTSKLQIVGVLANYWTDLYIMPYIRCGPYIIGCIVGYYLVENKNKKTFQLSMFQWIAGWTICAALGFYSVFGLYEFSRTGEISHWWSWLYAVAGRLAFALALGWLTFACETNNGKTMNVILGHEMFVPLSKLTFCAYLMHPILLQLYYLSRPTAFHFTHSFQLLHMFFAAVFMSYAVALLTSLAFELPMMHIDRLLFGGNGKRGGKGPPASLKPARKRPLEHLNGTKNGISEDVENDIEILQRQESDDDEERPVSAAHRKNLNKEKGELGNVKLNIEEEQSRPFISVPRSGTDMKKDDEFEKQGK